MILYSEPLFQYNMDIAGTASCLVSREEVMLLNVRERILTIRLMEKVNANPAYADPFGIVARNGHAEPERQTASNSADNKS